MKTTSAKSKWSLLVLTLVLSMLVVEILLRASFGIIPGRHTYSQWFNEVDSLIPIRGYHADSDGIFKVNPDVVQFLHTRLTSGTANQPAPDSLENVSWEVYGLDRSFAEARNPGFKNRFSDFLKTLDAKPDSMLDDFESAVLEYSYAPVNADGFRSIAFKNYSAKRKKILLLGDSFTWGHSTQNITSSFADILLSKGYIVFNTGISGADPEQYQTIAEKYIPVLKPDYVVVNFFMGNDVQYYKRPVLPYKAFHFMNNASNIIACPHGIYFDTSKQAYDFVLAHYTIPPDNVFNRICSRTAVSTLAWKVLAKFNCVNTTPLAYKSYWSKTESLKLSKPVCNGELKQVMDLCESYNAKFYLLAIPDLQYGKLRKPEGVPGLFDSIKYYNPPVLPEDYKSSDGHYNEVGHSKYAEFIEQLIKTQ